MVVRRHHVARHEQTSKRREEQNLLTQSFFLTDTKISAQLSSDLGSIAIIFQRYSIPYTFVGLPRWVLTPSFVAEWQVLVPD